MLVMKIHRYDCRESMSWGQGAHRPNKTQGTKGSRGGGKTRCNGERRGFVAARCVYTQFGKGMMQFSQ